MQQNGRTFSFSFLFLFLATNWHAMIGAIESPSAAENEALAKFRPMVADILYKDYMKGDNYLLRWLRHFNLDLTRASNAVRTTHKWRRDNKIDGILNEDFSSYEKVFPYDMSSIDKEGRPVWLQLYGKWDVRKVALAGEIAHYNRFLDYQFEKITARVRELDEQNPNKNITQFILIIDMQGYNLRQQGCLACLPGNTHFILAYERHFASTCYRSILINTPAVFEQLYDILRPLLSEATKSNLNVSGLDKDKWSKDLHSLISRDQLPPRFGGNKKLGRQFD